MLFHASCLVLLAMVSSMNNDAFRAYQRLVLAIFKQAVDDSAYDPEARDFVRENGIGYLNLIGVPHPEKKIRFFLDSIGPIREQQARRRKLPAQPQV